MVFNLLLEFSGVLSGYGSMARVHPESGETYWWILPKVNIKLFNRVLADFAQHFGVGKYKRIVLAIDQAGWHTSELVEVPLMHSSNVAAFSLSRTTTG